MAQSWEHMRRGFCMVMAQDKKIRKDAFDESFTREMLAELVDEDSELISLYYGEDVSEEDAGALTAEIEELYPELDVDTHFGGQPIYYYVLAVE